LQIDQLCNEKVCRRDRYQRWVWKRCCVRKWNPWLPFGHLLFNHNFQEDSKTLPTPLERSKALLFERQQNRLFMCVWVFIFNQAVM
jgi:hypothetical protein